MLLSMASAEGLAIDGAPKRRTRRARASRTLAPLRPRSVHQPLRPQPHDHLFSVISLAESSSGWTWATGPVNSSTGRKRTNDHRNCLNDHLFLDNREFHHILWHLTRSKLFLMDLVETGPENSPIGGRGSTTRGAIGSTAVLENCVVADVRCLEV